jgi:hypothetical protein
MRHTIRHMKHQQTKLGLTAIWMLGAVVIIAMSGYLRSMSDVLMLAALAAAPPAAMWLWWNDPADALNQRIQTVHGNGIGKRPRF